MDTQAHQSVLISHGCTEPAQMPQLGFGTYKIPPDETEKAVTQALAAGYRHIDTAQMYGNEKGVGDAIARSGLARHDVFVTSKLNNGNHKPKDAMDAFQKTMEDLQLDYLDLFLVHWPMAQVTDLEETWSGMIEILNTQRVNAIGVSNYLPEHIDTIISTTGVTPAVNQIELHPYLTQHDVVAYHQGKDIVSEAWSPLARGVILDDPVINSIADKLGKTASQVVIRWHLQHGNVVIPKTTHPQRMAENFDVYSFELSPSQMSQIDALNRDERQGSHPDQGQGLK